MTGNIVKDLCQHLYPERICSSPQATTARVDDLKKRTEIYLLAKKAIAAVEASCRYSTSSQD
jgi:hypothetical protein